MTSNAFNKSSQQLDRPKVCKSPPPVPPPAGPPDVVCQTKLPTVARQFPNLGVTWSNIDNIKLKDGNEADADRVKDEWTRRVAAKNFGFVFDEDYNDVVGVILKAAIRAVGDDPVTWAKAYLSETGGSFKFAGSDEKYQAVDIPDTQIIVTFGSEDDYWNVANFSKNDVEDAEFAGCIWFGNDGDENLRFWLDWVELTVCLALV